MFKPMRCAACGYFDRGDLHICSACGVPHESRISADPALADAQVSQDWDELQLRRRNSRVQAWIGIAVVVIALITPIVWFDVAYDHGLVLSLGGPSRYPRDTRMTAVGAFAIFTVLMVHNSGHDWQYFQSVVLRWFRPALGWEIAVAAIYLVGTLAFAQLYLQPLLQERVAAPTRGVSQEAALAGSHTVMFIYYSAALVCTALFLIGTYFNPCDRASMFVRRRIK
ncbi:hypothetical protein GCM10022230_04740 [Pseudoclavibacter caeni]